MLSLTRYFKALWAPASIITLGLALSALVNPVLGALVATFGALDLHGRYRDFRWLEKTSVVERSRTLNLSVVSTANFVYFGRSYCGRQVVIAVDPSCRDDYLDHGYRWYHFLPDGFPRVMKKKAFWINLFKGHRT